MAPQRPAFQAGLMCLLLGIARELVERVDASGAGASRRICRSNVQMCPYILLGVWFQPTCHRKDIVDIQPVAGDAQRFRLIPD